MICKFLARTAQWWELHKNLIDGKSQHTPLKNLSIFTRLAFVNNANQDGEVFRFSSLVPANEAFKSTLAVEDSSYKKLWTKVASKYKIKPADEINLGSMYPNAYWGNELVRFSDDAILHIAIDILRLRGLKSIIFLVTSFLHLLYYTSSLTIFV